MSEIETTTMTAEQLRAAGAGLHMSRGRLHLFKVIGGGYEIRRSSNDPQRGNVLVETTAYSGMQVYAATAILAAFDALAAAGEGEPA